MLTTRHRWFFQIAVLLLGIAAGDISQADNTVVVVTPPDYSWLRQPSQQAAQQAGQQLGGILSKPSPKIIDAVLVTQCGHYKALVIHYSDGSQKTIEQSGPVKPDEVQMAQITYPILRVVDLVGCPE